jgi:hypothetical protein
MNNLETKLTITGVFIACLFSGVYYFNKKGTNYWSNKSIKDIANDFSTANKRDQKRMIGELSVQQIKDMHEELRSINNNNIANSIKAEEAYEEWAEKNNEEVDRKKYKYLDDLLDQYNKRSTSADFLSDNRAKGSKKEFRKRSRKHKRH